ncbi:MFS transporter [Alphaproteobacteria bacterium]|jgi:MFS family permease|nr:MFS transporter [Alphaproteobacteria bacterium]|tara:strand:+ start:2377 stop:3597 length:1221 start_codon:yes stop_codon:yes gene_type:complete
MNFILQNARWLAATALLYFCSSFGQTFFISLFAGEIREAFNLSHGDWGFIYSGGTLASAIAMLCFGGYVDKYKISLNIKIVVISLSLICLAMTFVKQVWILPFIIFGLRFFGQGMLIHIPAVAIGKWYGKNKGKALSLSIMGFSIGEAILPVIFVSLFILIGWRNSWLVGTIILFITLPIIINLLSNERIPNSSQENIIDQVGMGSKHWKRKEVLKHWVFWSVIIPFLIPPIFSTAFFFNMVHLTEIKNWSLITFTSLFPFYTGMSILTTLISGWILDKFGVEKILPFYLLPMALGLLVFSYSDTYMTAAIGFSFLGMTQGLAMMIGGTFWPVYYGTKNLGSVRSLSTSCMVFGTAIGPAVVGKLLDFSINYNLILLGMSFLAIIASVSLWFIMLKAPALLPNKKN